MTSDWMGEILLDDNAPLSSITMPGSHDATIYRSQANYTSLLNPRTFFYAPEAVYITQDLTIYEQCMAGSRFFDVRLELDLGRGAIETIFTGGNLLENSAVGFHRAGDLGPGGVGASAKDILDDLYSFITQHPTEFVIVRISHTGKWTSIGKIIEQHKISNVTFKYLDIGLSQMPINLLRGCVIFICEKKAASVNALAGIHNCSKYEKTQKPFHGIVICGGYSNSKDINHILKDQVTKLHTHYHKHIPRDDHFFVLSWTKTLQAISLGLDLFRGRSIESYTKDKKEGTHAKLDTLIKELSITPQVKPNVVSMDFVNVESCQKIIDINMFKKHSGRTRSNAVWRP